MSDKTPKIEVRVSEIHQVTPEIKRFHFKPVDGSPLPNFSGGAHVVVEMEDEGALRRNPYSLMSRPGADNYAAAMAASVLLIAVSAAVVAAVELTAAAREGRRTDAHAD